MSDIELDAIRSGYNLSKINSNFNKLEDVINDDVLHRSGGNNTMSQELDMNGNKITNVKEGSSSGDLATIGQVESIAAVYKGANFVQEELPGGELFQGATWYKPSIPTTYTYYIQPDGTGSWTEEASVGDDASFDNVTDGNGVTLRNYLENLETEIVTAGYTPVGFFIDGFTYERLKDVGVDSNGESWAYLGEETLPYTVPAGTIPTEAAGYQKVTYNTAEEVQTNTSETVQDFIDTFALKIFQSPTDGGLTEIQTRTVEAGEVYEVRKASDDSLATIYSDAAGTTEIVQNSTDNKSGGDGVVEFYIEDGDYYVDVGGVKVNFATFSAGNLNTSTGLNQQQVNDYVAPTIITDSATTSGAGIGSINSSDFKHDELNELLESKKYVTIDTEIYCNDELIVTNNNSVLQCSGAGVIYVGDDGLETMSDKYLIRNNAQGATFRLLRLSNPNMLKSQTGGRQGGIITTADNTTVENCIMRNMLQGVSAAYSSETSGTVVKFNKFLDMLGAGDGSGSNSSFGEDRGDAVTIWGRDAKIIGNTAKLLWGQDGRVAFHIESLDNSNSQTNGLIALNTAMGQYRRHYVMENVKRGIIANNISGGIDYDNPTHRQGATWFSAALIQTEQCSIDGLTVLWDRTASDTQGASWSPLRSAIAMINFSDRCSIDSVNIVGTSDSVGKVISGIKSGGEHTGLKIGKITAKSENSGADRGVELTSLTNPELNNIDITGYSKSIYSFRNSGGFSVDGFKSDDSELAIDAEYESTDVSSVKVRNFEISNTSGNAGAIRVLGDSINTSVEGGEFSSITGRDIELFNFNSLKLRNIENKDNTGLIRLYGSTSGVFSANDDVNFDYSSVRGYVSNWQHQNLSSAVNLINTEGKHRGLKVWSGGVEYTSTGNGVTDNWVNQIDGTVITPS